MNYKICNRCVMDNRSDNSITFDEIGQCNYCNDALNSMGITYFPNEEGKMKLNKLIDSLKAEGIGKKYDCVMGLSGGLDSSYLAYLGYRWGLRILAVHVDDGFDTETSKKNISRLVDTTHINLIIEKLDTKQFNALIKAYFSASVPNIAIPQDNIVSAYIYKYARKYKIKKFLSGGNFALECILQKGNTYRSFDVTNIKAIHKLFGTEPIDKLLLLSDYKRFFDQIILKIKTVRPLDYIDYNRERAIKELFDFCGFEYYGSKHLENTLTRFIQLYWFHNKYSVDKRHSHLSSMIVSGQLTRELALLELQKPLYDENEMKNEIKSLCTTLDISVEEFKRIMSEPAKQHTDFKIDKFYLLFKKFFFL